MKSPITLQISDASQVGEARRKVHEIALRASMSEEQISRATTVAVELATNLVKHTRGKGGELLIAAGIDGGQRPGISLLSMDQGPGMNIGETVRDGFSTAGTGGIGLGGIRRMASSFDVFSMPGRGSLLVAEIGSEPPGALSHPAQVAGLSVPLAGESACGDYWSWKRTASGFSVLVADGLGHGEFAAEASLAAAAAFEDSTDEEPSELLRRCHQSMRHTRGAAIALLSVNRAGSAYFAGIGNIAGVLSSPSAPRDQHLVSLNGIAGHDIRRIQTFSYPIQRDGTLVLHSDGISTKWDLSHYPGIMRRHPLILVGALLRDFRRTRDDATVVVARLDAGVAALGVA
jgi:anti-sigma regulatory factor (Ser/Thr protein kinase)